MLVDGPRRYGTTIVGPVAADTSWQARVKGGLTKAAFRVDWKPKAITCPAGKQSISWLPNTWPKNGMTFEVRFARRDLHALRIASALHPGQARAAHHRAARARALRGAAGRAQAPRDRGVPGSATPPAPGSRAPTPRPSIAAACDARATSAWPKRTSSTLSQRRPSTWFASRSGSRAFPSRERASRASPHSSPQPDPPANSPPVSNFVSDELAAQRPDGRVARVTRR